MDHVRGKLVAQYVRELLTCLDEFAGVLDHQRERIIASIEALNRLAGTFASSVR